MHISVVTLRLYLSKLEDFFHFGFRWHFPTGFSSCLAVFSWVGVRNVKLSATLWCQSLVLTAKVTLHDFTFLKMEGLRWFVLIYFNYSLVHCVDLKIGFLVDAFIFSVSRCSRHDLHWFWLPHDILEEVSFILHCQYWQIPALEILDHLVVKCSTFGPHTCVSRSVSSYSSTIIQQTWSLLWWHQNNFHSCFHPQVWSLRSVP